MSNIDITKLMTGTALALSLVAAPALAQTTAPETQPPAAQDNMPAPADTGTTMEEGATDSLDSDATTGGTAETEPMDEPATGQAETAPATPPATGQAEVPPAATGTDTIGETTADAAMGLPTEPILTQLEPGQMTSNEVIGMDVRNFEDESIGSINYLVIDEQNRVIAGVVSVGGFLGIGAKDVAVNWQEFSFNPEEKVAAVTLTREALEDAPSFQDRDDLVAERDADTPPAAPMTSDQPAGAAPPTTPPVTSE